MTEKKRGIFAGGLHVARARVQVAAGTDGPLWTEVRFRSRRELGKLVAALRALHDDWQGELAHIHLQDYSLPARGGKLTDSEIVFIGPDWDRDPVVRATHRGLVANAARRLKRA